MPKAAFPIQPELTAIAIAYRNGRMIADNVLPRVPVGTQEFKYLKHAKTDGFTVPDTNVGRTSRPNQVTFSATEETASARDRALDTPVPNADIENAPANYDPLGVATEFTTNLILLDREVRVANQVFNAANYPTGNKATLSGTSQWSHVDSKPLPAIQAALDSMIMRPNIAVFGRATATALRSNPSIVKAYNGTSGDQGYVPLAFLAELLELEEILVGEGFVNTARKGQTPSLQRVWGKHASFIFRDKNAGPNMGTTFGFTGQWGGRVAGAQFDGDIGMRGGQMVRVGESVGEVIAAPDLGYLFENAVA